MKKSLFIFGIIALLSFEISSNSFGDNQWVSIGPGGGDIRALAINPQTSDTLYAGTWGKGVFKSTNGGMNWTRINTGLTSGQAVALAINPQTPDTIYAGTDSGVFKSINGGTNWITMDTGLTNTYLKALAIDPQTPDTLYAGTDSGVFKSINGGKNWTAMNTGLTDTNVLVIAINPQTPDTLYTGTYTYSEGVFVGGVFKSTDGGTNWTPMNSGLTNTYVNTIAINPQAPDTLYAGTDSGVFKSTNGGTDWTAINSALTNTYSLAISPQTPDTLYAGTGDGVFESTNGGTDWSAINTGMTYKGVISIAINPQTPETIYAGTFEGGIFRSTNGGTSWNAIGFPIVTALVINPQTPTILYAGMGAVLKSENGGTDWMFMGLMNRQVYALAINPQTPDTLYAGTDSGVFKSINGGTDWTSMNNGLTDTYVYVLAINPQTPETLYAGTFEGGIFKSTDGGTNWTAMNTGLTNKAVQALAINPQSPDTLYAGTWGKGVFKSTNGGINWMNTGLNQKDILVTTLAINPQTPETLYAGTVKPSDSEKPMGGVFKSTNGGKNWTAMNTGLTDSNVLVIAINPQTPDTLYAGTESGGVFKIQQEAEPINPTLIVLKSGAGSGTVTSSPAGINCGNDCTEVYIPETNVTLTAKPDTNSTFTGWSGGGCSGIGTCVLIMNADIEVTATFSAKAPDISVSSDSVDFGNVKPGKKTTKTLKIANNGTGDLVITLSGLEGTDFSIQGSGSITIKAKKSYTLKVLCMPTLAGSKTATLEIQSNDPDTPTLGITLTATLPATAPDISVAQTSVEFGKAKVGKKVTKTLKITNNGTGDLMITLSGLEETDFGIQGSSSVTIKAKKSYSLKVLFTPKSADLKTATLEITSNDPDTPILDIPLSGIGQ